MTQPTLYDEIERLQALHRLEPIDTPPEPAPTTSPSFPTLPGSETH